jgi:ubiquinone/menaquinone biosynthesis C-methylase UbiE
MDNSLILKKRYAKNKSFIYGSITRIPFPNESFDGVTCFDVLEHISDSTKAMQEFHRVLKREGKLIIKVASMNNPTWFWNDPTHVRPYTKYSTNLLLVENKFNPISIEPYVLSMGDDFFIEGIVAIGVKK